MFVGDIDHSRVVGSNALLFKRFGANLTFCGPATLVTSRFKKFGKISPDLDSEIPKADVVMMLRIQLERHEGKMFPSVREYRHFYGLNRTRLALLKPDAIIMHPGPMNRGVEIDSCAAESKNSVIEQQVSNGVPIRMAVLKFCLAERRISASRRLKV